MILLVDRAEAEQGVTLHLDKGARQVRLDMADGDGRALLNLIEQIAAWKVEAPLDKAALGKRLSKRDAQYDKGGDEHYNLISALHKSVRGSDPDAAPYWFARMLEGGEEPRYLPRPTVRRAAEESAFAEPPSSPSCPT